MELTINVLDGIEGGTGNDIAQQISGLKSTETLQAFPTAVNSEAKN